MYIFEPIKFLLQSVISDELLFALAKPIYLMAMNIYIHEIYELCYANLIAQDQYCQWINQKFIETNHRHMPYNDNYHYYNYMIYNLQRPKNSKAIRIHSGSRFYGICHRQRICQRYQGLLKNNFRIIPVSKTTTIILTIF